MAAALSPAQLQAVEQQMSADPSILQALKTYQQWQAQRGRLAYVQKGGPPNPQQVLKAHGIEFPDIEDYQIKVDPTTGQVALDRQNWFQRNADWVVPLSVFGTAGVANAVAAPAAAASGSGSVATGTSAADAAAAGVLPSTGSIGVSALPAGGAGLGAGAGSAVAAGTSAGTAAGTAAAGTGFGAALKAALPTIIGAGASLGGAAIASHGNTEAAKIQAEQADRALAQAKQIYQQQRSDLSPYREEGFQALGPLNFGLGLPAPTRTTGPFDQTATSPVVALGAKDAQGQPIPGAGQNQVIPPPPTYAQEHAGTLSQIGQGGLVSMQNPQTGLVHLIPSDQVAAAQQAGGIRV